MSNCEAQTVIPAEWMRAGTGWEKPEKRHHSVCHNNASRHVAAETRLESDTFIC